MRFYSESLARLLDELERLPGIGPKSAQRIAFHLLKGDEASARRLSEAIVEAKGRIRFCARCFNLAEEELCAVCADQERDASVICVVEEPRDVVAVERTGEFSGVYHVLQGALSPIDGIGPDQLRVMELVERLRDGGVTEVIVATDPDAEGETTALYIARLLKPLGVKVTRIASGLPVGGDLEFADEVTLGKALEARREL